MTPTNTVHLAVGGAIAYRQVTLRSPPFVAGPPRCMLLSPSDRRLLARIAMGLGATIIACKTIAIVAVYGLYLPPGFSRGFLAGRERAFFDWYAWAFYPHIVAGPPVLGLGLFLLMPPPRKCWAATWFRWHRRLGRVQALLMLLVLLPSGALMSLRATGGPGATAGFLALSVAIATFTLLGVRAVWQRRLPAHRRHMQRVFVLLCSTLVLRWLGGGLDAWAASRAVEPATLDRAAIAIAWLSWLAPLAALEGGRLVRSAFAERRRASLARSRLVAARA